MLKSAANDQLQSRHEYEKNSRNKHNDKKHQGNKADLLKTSIRQLH
jgi:hypothetical protein